jgi:hypothetical protein
MAPTSECSGAGGDDPTGTLKESVVGETEICAEAAEDVKTVSSKAPRIVEAATAGLDEGFLFAIRSFLSTLVRILFVSEKLELQRSRLLLQRGSLGPVIADSCSCSHSSRDRLTIPFHCCPNSRANCWPKRKVSPSVRG